MLRIVHLTYENIFSVIPATWYVLKGALINLSSGLVVVVEEVGITGHMWHVPHGIESLDSK